MGRERRDKTGGGAGERRVKQERDGKRSKRNKKRDAHDERNDGDEGDLVEVMETRPLSKTKRWRVTRVVERAR